VTIRTSVGPGLRTCSSTSGPRGTIGSSPESFPYSVGCMWVYVSAGAAAAAPCLRSALSAFARLGLCRSCPSWAVRLVLDWVDARGCLHPWQPCSSRFAWVNRRNAWPVTSSRSWGDRHGAIERIVCQTVVSQGLHKGKLMERKRRGISFGGWKRSDWRRQRAND